MNWQQLFHVSWNFLKRFLGFTNPGIDLERIAQRLESKDDFIAFCQDILNVIVEKDKPLPLIKLFEALAPQRKVPVLIRALYYTEENCILIDKFSFIHDIKRCLKYPILRERMLAHEFGKLTGSLAHEYKHHLQELAQEKSDTIEQRERMEFEADAYAIPIGKLMERAALGRKTSKFTEVLRKWSI